jgi:hydroxyethylthiazole kinase-like uncharacterized protein yjeF
MRTVPPVPRPVYRTAEIRAIEQAAGPVGLMERAGHAAAVLARELLGASGTRALVVAGPGNNGGDGFVLARILRQWFFAVDVVFTGRPDALPPDAAAAHGAWIETGGTTRPDMPAVPACDLVVDALFGIGLARPLQGDLAALVARMQAIGRPILALDVPSGLDADTGRVPGAAVRADHTITFIGLKPGLLTLDGPDHCGTVHVCDLGLDTRTLCPPTGRLLDAGARDVAFLARPRNAHKGTSGSVGIVGGALGMTGAAFLAGRAALRAGAGRVYVGLIDDPAPAGDPGQPELMVRTVDRVLRLDHLTALAVGPGLGISADAALALDTALATNLPLVLDADALNLLGAHDGLRAGAIARTAPTVLTPHPAEAARLARTTTAAVQADRLAAALDLASRFRAHVVLKGAGSICAHPDGRWAVNASGNPGLAAAGMGDVLTGVVVALVGQGRTADCALEGAVWTHGAAADRLVADGIGPIGLTAGELVDAIRALANTPPREYRAGEAGKL